MGTTVVKPIIKARARLASTARPFRAPLEQQIVRRVRSCYRGQAAEEWLRACLRCLRNGKSWAA
jgi:hypothetical protein